MSIVSFSIITTIIIISFLYLFYLFMEWQTRMEANPGSNTMNLSGLIDKNIISQQWVDNNKSFINRLLVKPFVNYHYRYSKFWTTYYKILYLT